MFYIIYVTLPYLVIYTHRGIITSQRIIFYIVTFSDKIGKYDIFTFYLLYYSVFSIVLMLW